MRAGLDFHTPPRPLHLSLTAEVTEVFVKDVLPSLENKHQSSDGTF